MKIINFLMLILSIVFFGIIVIDMFSIVDDLILSKAMLTTIICIVVTIAIGVLIEE